jgi:hypothetical protein
MIQPSLSYVVLQVREGVARRRKLLKAVNRLRVGQMAPAFGAWEERFLFVKRTRARLLRSLARLRNTVAAKVWYRWKESAAEGRRMKMAEVRWGHRRLAHVLQTWSGRLRRGRSGIVPPQSRLYVKSL